MTTTVSMAREGRWRIDNFYREQAPHNNEIPKSSETILTVANSCRLVWFRTEPHELQNVTCLERNGCSKDFLADCSVFFLVLPTSNNGTQDLCQSLVFNNIRYYNCNSFFVVFYHSPSEVTVLTYMTNV